MLSYTDEVKISFLYKNTCKVNVTKRCERDKHIKIATKRGVTD